jgi:hypothetical protein
MDSKPTTRAGRNRLALCALLGAVAAACDSPSEPPVPATLTAVAGDSQSGIAGAALTVTPGIRVEDARGRPVADVPVTFAVVEGGGTVEAGETRTDRTGTASPGMWTLGPRVGVNALAATVHGLPPLRFTATAAPGAPAALRVHAGAGQSTTVGQRVAVVPTLLVLDAHDNPVPGAPVTFAVTAGEGVLEGGGFNGAAGASTVTLATNADGLASPAAWQVGTSAGLNALEARVAGLAQVATFFATGEAGPAALIVMAAGGAQSATAGSSVTVAPAVRVTDAHGNAVRDVAVTFAVIQGDGSLLAAGTGASEAANVASSTGADGVASVAAWRLGTLAGDNALEVRATGVAPALGFHALATAGPAALLTVQAGNNQVGPAGSRLPIPPAVHVADAFGNSVAGATVTFEITDGGGAVSGATRSSGPNGVATVEAWDLGPLPGPNTLSAHAGPLAPVSFTATGTQTSGGTGGAGGSGGGFTLELRYTSPLSGTQLAAFGVAADRWNTAITGDVPDIFINLAANSCGAPHPAVSETVDDILIFVTVTSIDGPGKILGSAGPCRIRSGSNLPVIGVIYLDADDLAGLAASGLLDEVVIHEMGHVLGIGTLWPASLVTGSGGTDPFFSGPGAVSQFLAAGGSAYSGSPVPIENTGGAGTKDAHWRESVLATEIMTGWINAGGNPLSRITIASLGDMGYQVDTGAADSYQLSSVSALGQAGALPFIEMLEGKLPPPIVVDDPASAAASPLTTSTTPIPKKKSGF